jgi:hypothetical protein
VLEPHQQEREAEDALADAVWAIQSRTGWGDGAVLEYPYARLDETLEAIGREKQRDVRNAYRTAAYTAYLLTPNSDSKTFGAYLGELGMGLDGDTGSEASTDEDLREAMEVCAEADALAAAGAYRKVSGVGVIKMTGAMRG